MVGTFPTFRKCTLIDFCKKTLHGDFKTINHSQFHYTEVNNYICTNFILKNAGIMYVLIHINVITLIIYFVIHIVLINLLERLLLIHLLKP